jgi:hypothetical protein
MHNAERCAGWPAQNLMHEGGADEGIGPHIIGFCHDVLLWLIVVDGAGQRVMKTVATTFRVYTGGPCGWRRAACRSRFWRRLF